MGHQYFRGVTGEAVGEDRDEGAALTASEHGLDDRATVGPQHAAVVGHRHAGRALHGEVDQFRRPAPQGRVLAVAANRGHDVITELGLGDEARDFLRRVLQVGVEGNDDIALALLETGHDCRVLAVVAVEDHRHHRAALAAGSFLEDLGRLVATAVVDHDDFIVMMQLPARRFGTSEQLRQAVLFVVDRDDNRHASDRVRFHRWASSVCSMALTTRSISRVVMSGNNGIEHSRAEFHSVLGRETLGNRWR